MASWVLKKANAGATAQWEEESSLVVGVDIPANILLDANISESAGVEKAVPSLQYTPEANSVYQFWLNGVFSAAAVGTGLQFRIDPGNGTGATYLNARGASATAEAVLIGTQSTTMVQGASSGSGETPFGGWSIITASGDPTPVQVYFRSESNGSEVELQGGKCVLSRRRLVP